MGTKPFVRHRHEMSQPSCFVHTSSQFQGRVLLFWTIMRQCLKRRLPLYSHFFSSQVHPKLTESVASATATSNAAEQKKNLDDGELAIPRDGQLPACLRTSTVKTMLKFGIPIVTSSLSLVLFVFILHGVLRPVCVDKVCSILGWCFACVWCVCARACVLLFKCCMPMF